MVFGRRGQPRPVVTQVIHVGPVDEAGHPQFGKQVFEPGVELRLAEVTAVRRVAKVIRVLELAGLDDSVFDPDLSREVAGFVQFSGRQTRADGRHRERPLSQCEKRHLGDEGTVDSARECDRDPLHPRETLEESITLRRQFWRQFQHRLP